jgi:hypothetical protein
MVHTCATANWSTSSQPSQEAAWHESGSEQAAEMMVWGLFDRPVRIVTIINEHSCNDLDAGYRAFTGQPPLHGYRDYC